MTIKELIEKLNFFDGNARVLLSSDAEGNKYSVLDNEQAYGYMQKDWNGYDDLDIYDENELEEDLSDYEKAIILFPR